PPMEKANCAYKITSYGHALKQNKGLLNKAFDDHNIADERRALMLAMAMIETNHTGSLCCRTATRTCWRHRRDIMGFALTKSSRSLLPARSSPTSPPIRELPRFSISRSITSSLSPITPSTVLAPSRPECDPHSSTVVAGHLDSRRTNRTSLFRRS